MALPRKMRFPDRRAVRRALTRGRRMFVSLGRVVISPPASGSGCVLFVVPAAVSKRSSERNRIRRRLEAWAERVGRSGRLPAANIVIFVSPAAAGLSTKALWQLAEESFPAITPRVRR